MKRLPTEIYRVWCKFEPNHINLPAGRRGQWRVEFYTEGDDYTVPAAWSRSGMVTDWESGTWPLVSNLSRLWPNTLMIASTKPYPKGSIICPHKALNHFLAARKAARNDVAS